MLKCVKDTKMAYHGVSGSRLSSIVTVLFSLWPFFLLRLEVRRGIDGPWVVILIQCLLEWVVGSSVRCAVGTHAHLVLMRVRVILIVVVVMLLPAPQSPGNES
jgi:hypothetical protein